MKIQRFDYYDEDFYDNGRLMGNDEVLILLNQAENKIDKLQQRSRKLFFFRKSYQSNASHRKTRRALQ